MTVAETVEVTPPKAAFVVRWSGGMTLAHRMTFLSFPTDLMLVEYQERWFLVHIDSVLVVHGGRRICHGVTKQGRVELMANNYSYSPRVAF